MPGDSNMKAHLKRCGYVSLYDDWYIKTETPVYLAHLCRRRDRIRIEFVATENLDGWPPCGEPIPDKVRTQVGLAEVMS